ncbi:HAD family hydrolase [Denitrobaculum tricleocarpae]|nr:HAD family hydrolase [Denitrobaculum tricleocarpae]
MKLVIFDIDGTLVRSDPHEDRLFWQALVDVLGVRRETFEWNSFRHVTDSGITQEVFRRQFGRDPEGASLAATEEHFGSLWQRLLSTLPRDEIEVPGARAMLAHLNEHPDWTIAIATGGWERTARAKLGGADIAHAEIPMGCANDALAREDIMAIAQARATIQNANKDFERVVYVGDGEWDAKTCRAVGMPLVGMAVVPEVRTRLSGLGVSHILEDYCDRAAVLEALDSAQVPPP